MIEGTSTSVPYDYEEEESKSHTGTKQLEHFIGSIESKINKIEKAEIGEFTNEDNKQEYCIKHFNTLKNYSYYNSAEIRIRTFRKCLELANELSRSDYMPILRSNKYTLLSYGQNFNNSICKSINGKFISLIKLIRDFITTDSVEVIRESFDLIETKEIFSILLERFHPQEIYNLFGNKIDEWFVSGYGANVNGYFLIWLLDRLRVIRSDDLLQTFLTRLPKTIGSSEATTILREIVQIYLPLSGERLYYFEKMFVCTLGIRCIKNTDVYQEAFTSDSTMREMIFKSIAGNTVRVDMFKPSPGISQINKILEYLKYIKYDQIYNDECVKGMIYILRNFEGQELDHDTYTTIEYILNTSLSYDEEENLFSILIDQLEDQLGIIVDIVFSRKENPYRYELIIPKMNKEQIKKYSFELMRIKSGKTFEDYDYYNEDKLEQIADEAIKAVHRVYNYNERQSISLRKPENYEDGNFDIEEGQRMAKPK